MSVVDCIKAMCFRLCWNNIGFTERSKASNSHNNGLQRPQVTPWNVARLWRLHVLWPAQTTFPSHNTNKNNDGRR